MKRHKTATRQQKALKAVLSRGLPVPSGVLAAAGKPWIEAPVRIQLNANGTWKPIR